MNQKGKGQRTRNQSSNLVAETGAVDLWVFLTMTFEFNAHQGQDFGALGPYKAERCI